jgi:hypothetical protein
MVRQAENVIMELLYKECRWFEPGRGFTCKAKDIGLYSFVQCLEEDSHECPFLVCHDNDDYCICPARVDTAKACEK